MARSAISTESLLDLRRRLSSLPPRSSARRQIMQETAALFGVSEATVYRALQHPGKPRALQRADRGLPRILPRAERERSVELSAAIKVRTAKRKGRHLSTSDAIRLLEEDGLE